MRDTCSERERYNCVFLTQGRLLQRDLSNRHVCQTCYKCFWSRILQCMLRHTTHEDGKHFVTRFVLVGAVFLIRFKCRVGTHNARG